MKEWLRLRIDRRCGCCGASIVAGEFALALGAARKLRCWRCAGEPPPEMPPPLIERPRQTAPLPMTRFTRDMLPLDWKAAAIAEREPGEEG